MTDNKTVMQQALDALIDSRPFSDYPPEAYKRHGQVIGLLIEAIAQPVKVNASSILGAVARGWCHSVNAKKAMDVDLAIAISAEVNELLAQPVEPCMGCNGHGEVGGLRPDGYDSEICPFCKGSGTEQITQPVEPTLAVTDTEIKRAFPFNEGWNHSDEDLHRYRRALKTFLTVAQPVPPDDVSTPTVADALTRLRFFRELTGDERFKVLQVFGAMPDGVTADDMSHFVEGRLFDKAFAALKAQPAAPTNKHTLLLAEAYQVVGSLLSDLGQFDNDKGRKVLDNLSQGRMVHDDVLPWPSFEKKETEFSIADLAVENFGEYSAKYYNFATALLNLKTKQQ